MNPLLIMKTGSVLPEADTGCGDFEDWFATVLGEDIPVKTVDVRGELPKAPNSYSGVIITGSPAMVSDQADWSEAAAGWLKQAVEAEVPVLGVCFGHQLLAHALGGRVGRNPNGRQMGTQPIALAGSAATDVLFENSPETFPAQTSHQEAVLTLPPDAVLLATSPRDDHHAFRHGHNAWGIQFHPEFSIATTRAYISAREDALRAEDQDPEALGKALADTPEARAVLRRFGNLCRQQAVVSVA